MAFNWGDIITAAVPGIIQAGAGIIGGSLQEDREQAALDQQAQISRDDQVLQLKLAALKAQYSGGGGGGGSGINPNKLTKAQEVSAVAGQGDSQQKAIANLIASLQGGYGLAARG